MGLPEFLALAGQYGLWNAVAAVCIVIGLLIWRGWVATRNDVAKSEAADSNNLTGAIVKLVEKLGTMDERSSVERSQMIGRMEGMTNAILKSNQSTENMTRSVDGLVGTVDEFGGRIQHLPAINSTVMEIKGTVTSLETNLGGSIANQFGPVVTTLIGIDNRLETLTKELHERDSLTNKSLLELIALFQDAKNKFMTVIEPVVLRHIHELLPSDTNGKDHIEPTKENTP